MRLLRTDGVTAFWIDYDKKRVSGWAVPRPQVGDELLCEMQSGKTARFRFTSVSYPSDPPDQYFADVEFVGYESAPAPREGGAVEEER